MNGKQLYVHDPPGLWLAFADGMWRVAYDLSDPKNLNLASGKPYQKIHSFLKILKVLEMLPAQLTHLAGGYGTELNLSRTQPTFIWFPIRLIFPL